MNKDDPAFPHERVIVSDGYVQSKEHLSGLTKREYFAAMAMQGVLANDDLPVSEVGVYAVRYADSLIAALEKKV